MIVLSTERLEGLLIGLSFSLFYYIMFKIKKIEVQVNIDMHDEEYVIGQLINLILTARGLYLIYFLTLVTEASIFVTIERTSQEDMLDRLK